MSITQREAHSLGRWSIGKFSITDGDNGSVGYKFDHKRDDNGDNVLAFINGEYWMVPLTAHVPAIRVTLEKTKKIVMKSRKTSD
jgi:hypothetical protein